MTMCSNPNQANTPAPPEAGKTGPDPKPASSLIGTGQKAKTPPGFALNEAIRHRGIASKANFLAFEQETLKTMEHAQIKMHKLLMIE